MSQINSKDCLDPSREDFSNQIDYLIKTAMSNLSAKSRFPHFGIKIRGEKNLVAANSGENQFQIALCKELRLLTINSNWCWCRELSLTTLSLTNARDIKIDIFGSRDNELILIELKYVTHQTNKSEKKIHPPNDPPAFAYDVLKDCIKIELACKNETLENGNRYTTSPVISNFKVVYGASIGLTNWQQYWNINLANGRGGWARNYMQSIAAPQIPKNKKILTEQNAPDIINRTIYHHERCHLSFGLDWNLDWIDYSSSKDPNIGDFRYLFIRLKSNQGQTTTIPEPSYGHEITDSKFIPFLQISTKNEFNQIREKINNL